MKIRSILFSISKIGWPYFYKKFFHRIFIKNQITIKEIEARIDIVTNEFDANSKSATTKEENIKKEGKNLMSKYLNMFNKKKFVISKNSEEKQLTTKPKKLRSNLRLFSAKKSTKKLIDIKLDKKIIKTPAKSVTRKNSAECSPNKNQDIKLATPNKLNDEESQSITS
jgi:hypothetical protein